MRKYYNPMEHNKVTEIKMIDKYKTIYLKIDSNMHTYKYLHSLRVKEDLFYQVIHSVAWKN